MSGEKRNCMLSLMNDDQGNDLVTAVGMDSEQQANARGKKEAPCNKLV